MTRSLGRSDTLVDYATSAGAEGYFFFIASISAAPNEPVSA